MPRFLCRLRVEVRGGSGAQPPAPPAPFKLTRFNNEAPDELGPLVVEAEYAAARDVTATDAVDANSKVAVFATANVPALVPAGGRVAAVHVAVVEWPT